VPGSQSPQCSFINEIRIHNDGCDKIYEDISRKNIICIGSSILMATLYNYIHPEKDLFKKILTITHP